MDLPATFTIEEHGAKSRIACFGGIYSNARALVAFFRETGSMPPGDVYCLGDLTGAYSAAPERVLHMLRASAVNVLQGNHDFTLAHDVGNCACGYAPDSADAHWAQRSYDLARCGVSPSWNAWLAALPHQVSLTLGDRRVRVCHGSPRVMNEFLWESLEDDFYRELLAETGVDVIVCTHTGLPWTREVAAGQWIVNVGVLGRPANDGTQRVWYAELAAGEPFHLVPLEYDWASLVCEMSAKQMPEEFVGSIREGWWKCCYDILPKVEARRGKYSHLGSTW